MSRTATSEAEQRPLCVDLDGTLIATDTLWESLFLLVRTRPAALLLLPWWLMQGKARLKDEIARRVLPNVAVLPYRPEVLGRIEEARNAGRPVLLVTAAHRLIADAVQAHLGLFDEVLASDPGCNLRSAAKARALVDRFGEGGFDYLGDGAADLPVWKAAGRAHLVAAGRGLARRAARVAGEVEVVSSAPSKLWPLIRALRPHQWVKNILLLVPAILAHVWANPPTLAHLALALLAFSLCASTGYIINDLFDLESDRQHHRKRRRPFASGVLSIPTGIWLALVVLGASLTISILLLPRLFAAAVGGYLVITLTYSLYLKRKLIIDVVMLALLFTYRVLAGGLAVEVPVSFWLLAFSLFMFTGLAFAKRYSELSRLQEQGGDWAPGRSYRVADLMVIKSVGSASSLIAVLVFALYINSPGVTLLYPRPQALWLICPIFLYWVTRVWFIAARGQLHDDPIVFAIKDRVSYLAGLATAACLLIATW